MYQVKEAFIYWFLMEQFVFWNSGILPPGRLQSRVPFIRLQALGAGRYPFHPGLAKDCRSPAKREAGLVSD